MLSMQAMRTLFCTILFCALLTECSAQSSSRKAMISSIYINTPDSSVKASVTSHAEKNVRNGRYYHWYASNQLCVTNGGYSGKLLHGLYSSFYPNHYLLAQGQFRNGLKDGCWKHWLPDGTLHEIIHYKNGLLNGIYELYSPNGQIARRIYYRRGGGRGKTIIFSQDGKDSVIVYKNGETEERRETRAEKKKKSEADTAGSVSTTDGRRQTGVEKKKRKSTADTVDRAGKKEGTRETCVEKKKKKREADTASRKKEERRNPEVKKKNGQSDSSRVKRRLFRKRSAADTTQPNGHVSHFSAHRQRAIPVCRLSFIHVQ
jgi:hypothetical protein